MNSAHASLLQWLQENPQHNIITMAPIKNYPYWTLQAPLADLICSATSYEAACYDLLQQLKK